ncbi:hypothetical protein BGZ46_003897 [Entomortierella lignicola]|nr:hypothetical protein BGZ46_003897 [Entomortierella lignicola]
MFNANSQKSLYSSTYGETKTRKGYGSNVFYTDSDSDSLLSATANVRLQESSANDSCQHKNETPISIMISNLAQSLLEGCPQLSRLVVNESLLIEDHEGIQDPSLRGQPQQLAMLIQAIPKLKEFVAHMCVVAKCPGLIETLLEYHHPHLVSFKVLHDTHEVDPHHLQRPSLQHLQQIDQQKPYQQEYQQQQTQEEYHQYPEQQWQQQQQPSLFQRILQLQQQQQQQQLEYLTRLRQGCLRILELCPELKEFESEIPLVLEDLIASVPRWACERALRVLRLEVQELTVDGGLDPEEEGVMQMFITSLFKSSRSQQHRRDPQLQLESQLQLEPQSEPLSVRLNAPYSISTDQSATGSSSSNATGSTAGYRASSGSISSSSDNSISGGSGNWTSSGSQEVLSVPPNLPGSGIGHTASSSDIYAESISETSSFSQSLSSMSISPTNIKEQPLVGDECDGNAASWTSSSDQSSFESGKGLRGSNRRHHHRHQNQHPYQHHLHRRTIHNQNCTYNHASDLVQTRQPMPSPPPPPMPQDESLSMAAIPSPYSTRLPSYYQIGAVGRLVALQFLIEHQLVYLPKLDQLFLGNRMYTIPSIDRSS